MNILIRLKNLLSKSIVNKKEVAVIAITLVCFAISGIVLPNFRAEMNVDTNESSIVHQDKESAFAKASKSKKKERTEEKNETTTEATETTVEQKEEDISKEETTDKAANGAVKESTANKNSSNHPSSSNSSSGNSSTPASPPQQEKVWVPPVYQTVHHDAVYDTLKIVVCNYCGAEFGSTGEFQVHKDANGG